MPSLSYSSVKEGFNETPMSDVYSTINNKMSTLQNETNINSFYTTRLNSNFLDVSNHLTNYYSLRQKQTDKQNANDASNPQSKNGITFKIDATGNVSPSTTNPTAEVVQDDLNQIILQHNTIYITGTLACATLLIAAILVGSK